MGKTPNALATLTLRFPLYSVEKLKTGEQISANTAYSLPAQHNH